MFTGSSVAEQQRYAESMESLEMKLRKNNIFIPTMDDEVKIQVGINRLGYFMK